MLGSVRIVRSISTIWSLSSPLLVPIVKSLNPLDPLNLLGFIYKMSSSEILVYKMSSSETVGSII